jgi:hypothetical protein
MNTRELIKLRDPSLEELLTHVVSVILYTYMSGVDIPWLQGLKDVVMAILKKKHYLRRETYPHRAFVFTLTCEWDEKERPVWEATLILEENLS